jgi:hypothetical protein
MSETNGVAEMIANAGEPLRNALRTVITREATKIAKLRGDEPVKITVAVTNDVQPAPVTNESQPPPDLGPLVVVLQQICDQFENALTAMREENAASRAQISELIQALRAQKGIIVTPAPVTIQPAPVLPPAPERPKREICIERKGDKMYVTEV